MHHYVPHNYMLSSPYRFLGTNHSLKKQNCGHREGPLNDDVLKVSEP